MWSPPTRSLLLLLAACRLEPGALPSPVDADGDGYASELDCNDDDPAAFPGATERCDGVDNDCNSFVDDRAHDGVTYFVDADGDGHGDPATARVGCTQPAGTALVGDDCDDANGDLFPGAPEDDCADPTDYNCDGAVGYANEDGDAFPACQECDDHNAAVYPGATEQSYNGLDDDCDPSTLDDDLDRDGFPLASDCNDADAAISPAAAEQPYNGLDDDCDPSTVDDDLDGDGFLLADDCDDDNAAVSPAATEQTYNGLDDDCDPSTLDDDLDRDGFPLANDCDDQNASINPGHAEVYYNGLDDDCATNTADDDQDADGSVAYAMGGDDCNDTNPAISACGSDPSAALPTCLDIHTVRPSAPDGQYWIDPASTGAVHVGCDMTTSGGGWTEVAYSADLAYIPHFFASDQRRWLNDDLSLVLPDATINALRARSTEGRQTYVGRCNGVLHYYYASKKNWDYAFAFRMHTGAETPFGQSYAPYDVTVPQDGCAGNGGELGLLQNATVFELRSLHLPVINVQSRDNGDAAEFFGSPLTDNPAWLR